MRVLSITVFVTVILYASAWAQSQEDFTIASSVQRNTSVCIIKDADYISMQISLSSTQSSPKTYYRDIKLAEELIVSLSKKWQGIEVHTATTPTLPVSAPRYYSSLSKTAAISTQSNKLHIMKKLDKNTDIYDAASEIRSFFDSIKLPSRTIKNLGDIQLAVLNKDLYRNEILKKIFQDIVFIKSISQSGFKVSLTDLQSPVLVKMRDNRKVELFINYSMKIEFPDSAANTTQNDN